MKKDEKPTKKVSNVERDEKREDKGLNPETVTKKELAQGFKIVLGFESTDEGRTLFADDKKGKRHVKLSYLNSNEELIDTLMKKLEPLQVEFSVGTGSIKRKIQGFSAKHGHMHLGVKTLDFDIDPDQRKEARKLMAEFINEEAAKDPIMWSYVSDIQRAKPKHIEIS